MIGQLPMNNEDIEDYRSYLLLMARLQLAKDPQNKIAASDIVQQTLFEAHQQRESLPRNPDEICAWLRRILDNNIRDQRRHWRRQKRDIRREQPIEPEDNADQALASYVAAVHSSPSAQVMKAESLLELSDALWQLPERQREAILLHHFQGHQLAEVAQRLDTTDSAVAGLLHRGLLNLRKLISNTDE
jgi:RNA polymerase sigma-70 factor (ECF subfamily)